MYSGYREKQTHTHTHTHTCTVLPANLFLCSFSRIALSSERMKKSPLCKLKIFGLNPSMCLAFSIQLDMARVYTQFICECLN